MALELDVARVVRFDRATQSASIIEDWLTLSGGSFPQQYQQASGTGGQSVARGEIGGVSVTLAASPGRTDLILSAPTPEGGAPQVLPVLKDVDGTLTLASELFGKLPLRGEVRKVALVLELSKRVTNQYEAAQLLQKDVPFITVEKNSIDLLYQVNLQKSSKTRNDVNINRLCRWATAVKQLLQIGFVPNSPSAEQNIVLSEPVYSVVLDLSTAPEDINIAARDLYSFISELANEAHQIIGGGYEYLASA